MFSSIEQIKQNIVNNIPKVNSITHTLFIENGIKLELTTNI